MTKSPEIRNGAEEPRHILSLSGGKDSTALALYMRDRVPNMEYVFCDTGQELAETYLYLKRLSAFLGRTILRLTPDLGFDDLLKKRSNFLPSPQVRWCTEHLKIRPLEKEIGDRKTIMYIGIRADEPHRKGYISRKANIRASFPFIEDGIKRTDVFRILEDSGLGLPAYYKWRTRSGCYFCFFQQRREWVGLREFHPDLFERAKAFERPDPKTGELYTWIQGESLSQLEHPERIRQIKSEHDRRRSIKENLPKDAPLWKVFADVTDDDSNGCLVCHL